MKPAEIFKQLQRRAEGYLRQKRLVVDYYRIRRRVAFEWPLKKLPEVQFPVVGLESYPWHNWLCWAIEERLEAMGWAAEMGGDEALRERCRREIAGVARWPIHSTGKQPDLPLGHFLRTLVLAKRNWAWLGAEAAGEIVAACRRALDQNAQWMAEKHMGQGSVVE